MTGETCKKSEKQTKKRLTFAGERIKMNPSSKGAVKLRRRYHSTFFYELLQGNLHETNIDREN
jgi:hypothetical protein